MLAESLPTPCLDANGLVIWCILFLKSVNFEALWNQFDIWKWNQTEWLFLEPFATRVVSQSFRFSFNHMASSVLAFLWGGSMGTTFRCGEVEQLGLFQFPKFHKRLLTNSISLTLLRSWRKMLTKNLQHFKFLLCHPSGVMYFYVLFVTLSSTISWSAGNTWTDMMRLGMSPKSQPGRTVTAPFCNTKNAGWNGKPWKALTKASPAM